MQNRLIQSIAEAVAAARYLERPDSLAFIEQTARWIADAFAKGQKVLVAGNGGSLCDAMHFAEELTGQFRNRRKAYPALALTDPSHLTCVGNDFGFEEVFSRGVEAFGQKGDLLAVLTTSGNSANILRAIRAAKERGLKTVAFLGKTGGAAKGLCDLEWIVEGFPYSDRIQEAHMAAIHIIIELVECQLAQDHYAASASR